jgi:HD-like signal output (HDOD) protein
MTTNKLISLDSVLEILIQWDMDAPFVETIKKQVNNLPTYPEPTKGSNHALLQEYINTMY